jgi:hypothetical protein
MGRKDVEHTQIVAIILLAYFQMNEISAICGDLDSSVDVKFFVLY